MGACLSEERERRVMSRATGMEQEREREDEYKR